jgi:hypothetical protein
MPGKHGDADVDELYQTWKAFELLLLVQKQLLQLLLDWQSSRTLRLACLPCCWSCTETRLCLLLLLLTPWQLRFSCTWNQLVITVS